jgi:diacylglycerol O-acyltransferase / wax synthase
MTAISPMDLSFLLLERPNRPFHLKGPAGQLYLAGAPLVAFHGLPILPPGAGRDVTFASVNNDICLGISAAPEAVDEPVRLGQLIEQAFHRLEAETDKAATTAARRPHRPA